MNRSAICVRPLTRTIGAEVDGVSLDSLDDAAFDEISAALDQWHVLCFRDQTLDLAAQRAFGARFGKLHIHPLEQFHAPGFPEVLTIRTDENSQGVAGYRWHSDVSCDEEPPSISMLYLTDVPEHGGDTLFASMEAAYDALSEPVRRLVDGLTARHGSEHTYSKAAKAADTRDGSFPEAIHPVVRVHPATGRRSLYVNRLFTTEICELNEFESTKMLELLCSHAEQAWFQCRVRWTPNMLVMWDNRCVQHLAVWDYFPEVRSGYRVTVQGERPIGAAPESGVAVSQARRP